MINYSKYKLIKSKYDDFHDNSCIKSKSAKTTQPHSWIIFQIKGQKNIPLRELGVLRVSINLFLLIRNYSVFKLSSSLTIVSEGSLGIVTLTGQHQWHIRCHGMPVDTRSLLWHKGCPVMLVVTRTFTTPISGR